MTRRLSAGFLIAANLMPLAGVIWWDWDVFLLLLLFWCENVVIGIFGIARLIVAGESDAARETVFLPIFFLVHYGGFMFGHFMVLFALYSGAMDQAGQLVEPADFYAAIISGFNWIALLALFVSHGWSFVENFMGNREHERLTTGQAMALPYRRMIITHIALLAGGFFLVEHGQPLGGLVMLLLLKIGLDLIFHRHEHHRLAPPD
jgi:hypothetical protein